MVGGSGGTILMRRLETASEYYDQVVFNTDAIFNEPAPEYWISFAIGGGLSIVGFLFWLHRVHQTKQYLAKLNVPFTGSVKIRAMISRAIDNDDPGYVVISFAAFSFLFLGGLQIQYEWTLIAMFTFYAVVSVGDSIRILLAVASAESLADVVQDSSIVHSKLRKVEATLKPANVYEDLGRGTTIVVMVFITQVILVTFIGVDTYENPTTKCRDGSNGCPVVGTLGSWGLYVLGIFMAAVYLLGPKTNYGQSEQNPAYWMHLLIAAKKTGATITWHDPVENGTMTRTLSRGDIRIWARFVMSFTVNGVAFHLLVHTLPIQIAAQSSLTGVVIRAMGMVYLVDLDDTTGHTLTITQEEEEKTKKDPVPVEEAANRNGNNNSTTTTQPPSPPPDASAIADETRRIIAEAKAQLDALSLRNYQSSYDRSSLKPGPGRVVFGGTKESDEATQLGGVASTDYKILYDRTSLRPGKSVLGGLVQNNDVTELDSGALRNSQSAYDSTSIQPVPGKILFAGTIESNNKATQDTTVGGGGPSEDVDVMLTA